MNINIQIPIWYMFPKTITKQILLRKWRAVDTTGRTSRGPGHRVGESHNRAKLTDHDVELIRQLHEGGMKQIVIAKKFDCSPANISEIVNYRHRITVGMGVNLVFE